MLVFTSFLPLDQPCRQPLPALCCGVAISAKQSCPSSFGRHWFPQFPPTQFCTKQKLTWFHWQSKNCLSRHSLTGKSTCSDLPFFIIHASLCNQTYPTQKLLWYQRAKWWPSCWQKTDSMQSTSQWAVSQYRAGSFHSQWCYLFPPVVLPNKEHL